MHHQMSQPRSQEESANMLEEAHHLWQEKEACNPATSAERLEALSKDPSLRGIVAGNPATPAYLLGRLAREQDARVREQVARNPNTPWPTLEQLAWEFPHDFLSNPVALLHMMVHPEQITTNNEFWGHLLREAAIPSPWWEWLRSHSVLGISQVVRLHIQYAGEAAHPYGDSTRDEEHDLLSLVELLSVASFQATSLLKQASLSTEQPEVTLEQIIRGYLQRLGHSSDGIVRQAVAANQETPIELLYTLAQDENGGVRCAVASHAQTPVELLYTLAQDEDRQVRCAVASHPQTPVEVLCTLGQDKDREVRRAVASHAQTPAEILRILGQDGDREVHGLVASHSQTPVETLSILARDPYVIVRRAVASNPKTPVEVFQTFLARHKAAWLQVMLVNHPQISGEMLRKLAQDQSAFARAAVASHPQVQEDVLLTLTRDHYEIVRRAAASHPRIPVEVLLVLAQDKKASVRAAVAAHPQAPVESLSRLAQDDYEVVRNAVAANPRTPVQVLQNLANDQSEMVRFWVATNPQTEADVLQKLTQDTCVVVRRMVYLVQQPADGAEEPLQKQRGWESLCHLLWSYKLGDVRWLLDEVTGLDVALRVRQSILALCAVDWDGEAIGNAFTLPGYNQHASSSVFLQAKRKNFQLIAAPFMPAIVLQKLAISPHWEVRYLVALHEQTPCETRLQLCQDGNRYVRAMAHARAKMMSEQA